MKIEYSRIWLNSLSLDPERQRQLIIILRTTQLALDCLAASKETERLAMRFKFLREAEEEALVLSESKITQLVAELDADMDANE